eukprot:s1599_g14.t1
MTLLVFAASFMAWRRSQAIEINAGHLEMQVAQDDTMIGQRMEAIPQLQQSLAHLREQSTEYSQHIEMLSDSVDGIYFGLVQLGGFALHRELTPQARRRMFEIERGNVVAMNAMGSAQYLSVVRQQSRGYAVMGDNTDPIVEQDQGEGAEKSESEEEDELLNPDRDPSTRAGELTTTVDDLSAELNEALAAEDWQDAAEIPRTSLMVLDNIYTNGMSDPATRSRVFHIIAESFARMVRNSGRHAGSPTTIARHRSIEESFYGRA